MARYPSTRERRTLTMVVYIGDVYNPDASLILYLYADPDTTSMARLHIVADKCGVSRASFKNRELLRHYQLNLEQAAKAVTAGAVSQDNNARVLKWMEICRGNWERKQARAFEGEMR